MDFAYLLNVTQCPAGQKINNKRINQRLFSKASHEYCMNMIHLQFGSNFYESSVLKERTQRAAQDGQAGLVLVFDCQCGCSNSRCTTCTLWHAAHGERRMALQRYQYPGRPNAAVLAAWAWSVDHASASRLS